MPHLLTQILLAFQIEEKVQEHSVMLFFTVHTTRNSDERSMGFVPITLTVSGKVKVYQQRSGIPYLLYTVL